MKCVSQFFFSKYNSKWAQAAESNQAEEVDGSLPRNVFPNKTAGPHYTLMSLKTPHCTSIFSSGPIMRSHPLPPSQLLSFSSTHLIITICSIFTMSLVGKSFLWCAVSSHLWKVQRQFFKEESKVEIDIEYLLKTPSMGLKSKLSPHFFRRYHKNIAKGTTDPRVEFILPK